MTYFVLQFFDKTCDRTLLTISIINFHGVKFYKVSWIAFTKINQWLSIIYK